MYAYVRTWKYIFYMKILHGFSKCPKIELYEKMNWSIYFKNNFEKKVTRENKMAQLYLPCSTGLYHCLIEETSKSECAPFLALHSECSDSKWIAEVQVQTFAVTPVWISLIPSAYADVQLEFWKSESYIMSGSKIVVDFACLEEESKEIGVVINIMYYFDSLLCLIKIWALLRSSCHPASYHLSVD